MIRLAALGLSHEANTFARGVVSCGDMERAGVLIGDAIVERHLGGTSTMAGYLRAGCDEVQVVPLVMTTLVPAGPIDADALSVRSSEMVSELLRQGPFDGVLVALHGAAVATTVDDVDGLLLDLIRACVGPTVPIGVSLDLHANISPRMVVASDVLNTYRTNPHLDADVVAGEVAKLIIRTVRGEVRPAQALVSIPAAINILRQNSNSGPMRELLDEAARLQDGRSDVLSVTIAEGYPYADVPEMGMSVVVVVDGAETAAQEFAADLADFVWDRRNEFIADGLSADDAINNVLKGASRTTLLLDVGDNIGAGSAGDSVVLLEAARRLGLQELLTIVNDASTAAAATRGGVGSSLDVCIGATVVSETGPPVTSHAVVLALHDGIYSTTEAVHAGMADFNAGPSAALRLDSGQTVVVTSHPTLPFTTKQLTALGLQVGDFRAVVAKGVHSPLAGYGPHVDAILAVDTPGVTSADLGRFTYRRRRRPMFPFEEMVDGFTGLATAAREASS